MKGCLGTHFNVVAEGSRESPLGFLFFPSDSGEAEGAGTFFKANSIHFFNDQRNS